jgi:hypothetical protein
MSKKTPEELFHEDDDDTDDSDAFIDALEKEPKGDEFKVERESKGEKEKDKDRKEMEEELFQDAREGNRHSGGCNEDDEDEDANRINEELLERKNRENDMTEELREVAQLSLD